MKMELSFIRVFEQVTSIFIFLNVFLNEQSFNMIQNYEMLMTLHCS